MMQNSKFVVPDWLQNIVKGVRPLIRDAFILSMVLNILALAAPVFVLQVYDRVVFHNGLSTLVGLFIGMLIVLGCDFFFRIVRARILQRVALELDISISRKVKNSFLHLPLRHLETKPSSYWQRIFHDSETIRNMVSGGAAIILSDIPFIILFLCLIFIIAQPIIWVVLCFVGAFCIIAVLSNRINRWHQSHEKGSANTRDRLLSELVMGRTTIKALGLDEHISPKLESAQSDYIRNSLNRARSNDFLTSATYELRVGSTVFIVSVGALAILSQDLTMGGLIASNMLASRLLQPLNQLIGTWKSFTRFRESVERLDDLFSRSQERTHTALSPNNIQGTIHLDSIQFGYSKDTPPILKNLNIPIKSGSLTAIVGPNGSGKTSLLKLIMGLYPPDKGRVLLDGGDMSQYDRSTLNQWIGYAPQETFLLTGSIRDNVLARYPTASDEKLREAANLSGLDAFVRLLPNGYDTDVGEAGAIMSGGVRQRIGLARAMLGKPQIILLDEPTSHLDHAAEIHLSQILRQYARNRTVIFVSHSPTLLSASNDLIMLSLTGPVKIGPTSSILQTSQMPAPSKGGTS